jgi:hypothetical protein
MQQIVAYIPSGLSLTTSARPSPKDCILTIPTQISGPAMNCDVSEQVYRRVIPYGFLVSKL